MPTTLTSDDILKKGLCIYPGICLIYKEKIGNPSLPDDKARDEIKAEFERSSQKDSDNELCFENEKFLFKIEKNDGRAGKHYDYVLRRLQPLSQLPTFFPCDNYARVIDDLAQIALYENWNFKGRSDKYILRNYLKYTYEKALKEETKYFRFSQEEDLKAFNTGLVDKDYYEPIYAFFKKNDRTRDNERDLWKFIGFAKGGNPVENRKSYQGKPREPRHHGKPIKTTLLDGDKPPRIDYQLNDNKCSITELKEAMEEALPSNHIINENIDRFPLEYQKLNSEEKIWRLNGAAKKAITRAEWDDRTIIPIYYPRYGIISFLLPLCLFPSGDNRENIDITLVFAREDLTGKLTVKTVLELDKAYMDARLTRKPLQDWLTPEAITSKEEDNTQTT